MPTNFNKLSASSAAARSTGATPDVARAEAAIKTSGTWLGGIDPEPGGGRRLLERGYDFAVVAADALLIRDGAAAAISQSRYQD